ncbi:MAG: hypothetical protein DRJ21_01610 [Candidatus Methanomethylicota archaeon]|uniref:Uncharacterized protein n=1 Tax=Thermoproteota archaeon TaxID=2056631 RepID=A0A497EUI6_9CREN|nr:MAG: hypothetical protein DRJ21_01610 [Candidatus Verstraetearchaeota archaeon]
MRMLKVVLIFLLLALTLIPLNPNFNNSITLAQRTYEIYNEGINVLWTFEFNSTSPIKVIIPGVENYCGDLDGDGKEDLIIIEEVNGHLGTPTEISIYALNGINASKLWSISKDATNYEYSYVTIYPDASEDNVNDIVMAFVYKSGRTDYTLEVVKYSGANGDVLWSGVKSIPRRYYVQIFTIADVSGDLEPDILLVAPATNDKTEISILNGINGEEVYSYTFNEILKLTFVARVHPKKIIISGEYENGPEFVGEFDIEYNRFVWVYEARLEAIIDADGNLLPDYVIARSYWNRSADQYYSWISAVAPLTGNPYWNKTLLGEVYAYGISRRPPRPFPLHVLATALIGSNVTNIVLFNGTNGNIINSRIVSSKYAPPYALPFGDVDRDFEEDVFVDASGCEPTSFNLTVMTLLSPSLTTAWRISENISIPRLIVSGEVTPSFDFTGDGVFDYFVNIWITNYTSGETVATNITGYSNVSRVWIASIKNLDLHEISRLDFYFEMVSWPYNKKLPYIFGDLNGDGLTEILLVDEWNGVMICLSPVRGIAPPLPRYAFTVIPPISYRVTEPGVPAIHTFMIRNIGELNDTYILSSDRGILSTDRIELNPGETAFFNLTDIAFREGVYIANITVTSLGNSTLSITIQAITNVTLIAPPPIIGGWMFSMDYSTESYSIILTVGMHEDATDGFDVDFDDTIPPKPPEADFEAYIWHPDYPSLLRRLSKSIVAFHDDYEWIVKVAFYEPTTVQVKWNLTDLLDALIRKYVLIFNDTSTGEVFNMITRISYNITSSTAPATRQIKIKALRDVKAPIIYNLNPPPNSTVGPMPIISANYTDDLAGINTRFIRMFLDGVNITDQCLITPSYIKYEPSGALGIGWHNVTLIVADYANNVNVTSWIFNVGLQYKLELKKGWNLISFPLIPTENTPEKIFKDIGFYSIYTYDSLNRKYIKPTTIEPGVGYWVLVLEDVNITISGEIVQEYERNLSVKGWHLIGSVLGASAEIEVTPQGMAYSRVYIWLNNRYYAVDAFPEGSGAWLLTYAPCTIHVRPKPPAPPPS